MDEAVAAGSDVVADEGGHRARVHAVDVEAAFQERKAGAAGGRADLHRVLAGLGQQARPADGLFDLRPRPRRRSGGESLREEPRRETARGARSWRCHPTKMSSVGCSLGATITSSTRSPMAASVPSRKCSGARRAKRPPAPGPRAGHGGIALLGGAVGIALEDVQSQRLGIRARAHARAPGRRRARGRASGPRPGRSELETGSSARSGSTLKVVRPGAGEGESQVGPAAASSRLSQPDDTGW